MLFLFIVFAQMFGITFHVAQAIGEVDKRSPDDTWGQVMRIFIKENWLSLFLSGVILLLDEFVHVILFIYTDITAGSYAFPIFGWVLPYEIHALIWSFVLGYAGQLIIYKLLEKLKAAAMKRLEDKVN